MGKDIGENIIRFARSDVPSHGPSARSRGSSEGHRCRDLLLLIQQPEETGREKKRKKELLGTRRAVAREAESRESEGEGEGIATDKEDREDDTDMPTYLYKSCPQVLAGNSLCRAGGGGVGGGWFGEFESVWKSSYAMSTLGNG